MTIRSLDELRDILRAAPSTLGKEVEECVEAVGAYAARHGLPTAHGDTDWSALPTFGGAEPLDTAGIVSWDADRQLVGTCGDDVAIEPRPSPAA